MSDRPRLEAVLLDAGGTLVRLDFEWMSEELARLGHTVDVERLRRGEVVGRRRYDASRKPAPPGSRRRSGAPATCASISAACSRPRASPPRRSTSPTRASSPAQEATGLWTRPAEGARAALDGLESMGLRCACVSELRRRASRATCATPTCCAGSSSSSIRSSSGSRSPTPASSGSRSIAWALDPDARAVRRRHPFGRRGWRRGGGHALRAARSLRRLRAARNSRDRAHRSTSRLDLGPTSISSRGENVSRCLVDLPDDRSARAGRRLPAAGPARREEHAE